MHHCVTEILMGSISGSLNVIVGKLVMSSPPWLPNCLATRSSSAAKASWRGGREVTEGMEERGRRGMEERDERGWRSRERHVQLFTCVAASAAASPPDSG